MTSGIYGKPVSLAAPLRPFGWLNVEKGIGEASKTASPGFICRAAARREVLTTFGHLHQPGKRKALRSH